KIDAVINLAGLAQVGASFGKEELYNRINVEVHTVLVKRLESLGSSARVVAIITGAVYDNHQAMPLNEGSTLTTVGAPYTLSKIAMEQALQPFMDGGMDIVIVRPFNHVGPGQRGGFLVPDLSEQLLAGPTVTV